MSSSELINYVELPASNLEQTKAFFSAVFGWQFEDFGPDYSAFSNQGLDGGFYRSELVASTSTGGALIVFLSDDLEATQASPPISSGITPMAQGWDG